jgi:hypothetical protein
MPTIQDYDIYYDGQDASQVAHIYERVNNQLAEPAGLCGAPRPANPRPSQQGTRPPNPVCPKCERLLAERDGQPLHPPRRP